MGQRFTFMVGLLILFGVLLSQPGRQPASFKIEYEKAEQLYSAENATKKTDSLAFLHYLAAIKLLHDKGLNDSVLFDSQVKAGILAMISGKDSLALSFFKASISLQQKNPSIADSLLFKPYLYAGNSYYNFFVFDTSLYYYQQAEALLQRFPTLSEGERLYNKTGVLYYEAGDYPKSIRYFTKALSVLGPETKENRYFLINYKNNIASGLRKLQQYDEALQMYKSLLPYQINTGELLHNIGATYLDAGQPAEALRYLQKVTYHNQAKFNDIGRVYLQLGNYSEAEKNLTRALALSSTSGKDIKNLQKGISLKYLGDCAVAEDSLNKALTAYQSSIIQLCPDFNDANISHNPQRFTGLNQYSVLFDALLSKARVWRKLSVLHPGKPAMIHCMDAYQSCIALASHVEKLYDTDEARLFLKKNADTAFHEFAEEGLLLYDLTRDAAYLQKVFTTVENSKASILQLDLHELELSSIPGISRELLARQQILKTELARLTIQRAQSGDNAQEVSIGHKMNDLELEHSHILAQLQQNKAYSELKFSNRNIRMDSLAKRFHDKGMALLSYYYTGNKLLCFYIAGKQYGLVSSSMDADLLKDIHTLREQLNITAGSERKTIQSVSSRLYRKLIQPVKARLAGINRLVIIPYNEIAYIPFELLTDPETNRPMLDKFAIRYDYSVNFLTGEKQDKAPYGVLALAPFSKNPVALKGMPALTASEKEVKGLQGKVLLDKEATKQNFLSHLGRYPILHLATHAAAIDPDPMQSYIAFYPDKPSQKAQYLLYPPEIYNLSLDRMKLVILSACETGQGQLVNGEGIMSLSRAFSYAGCKAVIASLWKADDESTAWITQKLHYYLQKGVEKDIALQKAKLDYLGDPSIEARYKTPAYWSHLLLIGNAAPVTEKPNTGYFTVVFIILLLLLSLRIRKTNAVHR